MWSHSVPPPDRWRPKHWRRLETEPVRKGTPIGANQPHERVPTGRTGSVTSAAAVGALQVTGRRRSVVAGSIGPPGIPSWATTPAAGGPERPGRRARDEEREDGESRVPEVLVAHGEHRYLATINAGGTRSPTVFSAVTTGPVPPRPLRWQRLVEAVAHEMELDHAPWLPGTPVTAGPAERAGARSLPCSPVAGVRACGPRTPPR